MTARTQTNGTGAAADSSRDDFPVDSFKAAAIHLRRPFTAQAVKFKVQATWPKGQDPTGGLIVCYIDARLAVERLNLIVPHLWYDDYEPFSQGLLLCRLTVDGITRKDVGEGQGKGLFSDALKRAAVKFGIGVSLYATPKMTLSVGDGQLKKYRDTLVMTPKGESRVRELYTAWLQLHGSEAFGHPLDHGDVDGAQGDAEVDDQSPAVASVDDTESAPLASHEDVAAMKASAGVLAGADVKLALSSCGLSGVTAYNKVPKAKVNDLLAAFKKAAS